MITFRGEHEGRVMYFDGVAVTLLKMMGMSGRTQGAMLAEEVPGALARLRAALAQPLPVIVEPLPVRDGQADDDEPRQAAVGSQQRAVPLIQLLEEALRNQSYIQWGK